MFDLKLYPTAPGVFQIPLGFVNAYAIENPNDSWILVDSGLKINAPGIREATEKAFGHAPSAIVLTHGHLDHAGGAFDLAQAWDVPIYAGRLELPFLNGKSKYPPQDPTVGGALALASRLMPHTQYDFGERLQTLPPSGHLEELPGWIALETPGHSPGHVSLWHEENRVLIAGDALSTADFDSALGMVTHKPKQFARGGSPFNCDWEATTESVKKLAGLEAVVVAAGHGEPISGGDVAGQMRDFARDFQVPAQGRYVQEAAQTSENGVESLPPAPPDPVGTALKVGAVLGALIAVGRELSRRPRKSKV